MSRSTAAGSAIAEAGDAHDARLRSKLSAEETVQLGELLDKLRAGLDSD